MKSRNRLESFSKDPIGFAAGDANLYRYVGNQPTTLTDPSGLEPPKDPWYDDSGWDYLNPWTYNFPLGQRTIVGWASGGWSATSRANELARQERTFRRQQAINDPCSQYAIDMQQTYRATPSELQRMREFAETGIQANATILGGGAIRGGGGGVIRRPGRAPEFPAGALPENDVIDRAIDWLGTGFTERSPGRFVSADGLRQFRYGAHETRNASRHHCHFEAMDSAGHVIENSVVEIQ